ncbi:MAG TPA: glycoside hydrolase family 3 C-terminal domain-containing protein [Sphingomonadaceae bacterium]
MLGTFGRWAAAGLMLAGATASWGQAEAASPTGSPELRAAAVLAEMTPEEKLTLVKGYFGTDFGTSFTAPPEARPGSAGYVPGVPRLGIPPQWQTDAGIGVATQGGAKSKRPATALPSGLAVAASWDPDVAYAGGRMIGGEARAYGFNVMLGGGVDLVREPRNGRNFEYAGEDPLLAGTIAGAAIAGVQSNHIVSTVKHYALNDQETDRGKVNVVIDESAARTSDLLAFELAIERGNPGSVMCAYNRIGGPYACESKHLLSDVLRKDWHYQGYVMSDWGAVHSAIDAVAAGLDQESGFGLHRDDNYGAKLSEALAAGTVSGAQLDAMAGHVLTAMFAHGLIDNPVGEPGQPDFAADQGVALRAAEAGAVLLKNDGGLLPLVATAKRIVVIGGHADKGVLAGGGSSLVYPGDGFDGGNAVPGLKPTSWPNPVMFYPSSPLEELRKALPGARVDYIDGTDPAAAARLAKGADVAIVFATQWTGESFDVPLTLPDDQDALIGAVATANRNTAVVLETGGPVLMPWNAKVKVVLEAWYPGRMGGLAIADLLTGKANPSGALPVTFPASLAQLPHPGALPSGTVTYSEGAAVGYKWFDKQNAAPLYPFGHGLSYTTFELGRLTVSQNAQRKVFAIVSLTNTGKRPGAKTVQLYAGPAAGTGGWEAPRRLVGFHKFELAPGQTQTAEIEIDPRLLATWRKDPAGWVIDQGDYAFGAGLSSRELTAKAQLKLAVARYLAADWRAGDRQ